MSEIGFFWLLLPVAAAAGWLLARQGQRRQQGAQTETLRSNYFRGLNYLLNEQPDKAIEVFLQIAARDQETVETQLALGNLFRRRGEVDRAIRLHQGLIARPNLDSDQKIQAMLALGEDYMRAGLLDRAENLFSDLVGVGGSAPTALTHLVSIYQQERDWHKAIEHARRLESLSGESQSTQIAHFYCELAEQALARHDPEATERHLDLAFASQPNAVRALMLKGRMAFGQGESNKAVRAFEQAIDQDIDCVPEVLPSILACCEKLGDAARAETFLRGVSERYRGVLPLIELARLREAKDGPAAAAAFLETELQQRPSIRGLCHLIEIKARVVNDDERNRLSSLADLTRRLIEDHPVYRCTRCGFSARAHHWQCPGCRSWSTMRPIHGIAVD